MALAVATAMRREGMKCSTRGNLQVVKEGPQVGGEDAPIDILEVRP
jgi:hypothetical protein